MTYERVAEAHQHIRIVVMFALLGTVAVWTIVSAHAQSFPVHIDVVDDGDVGRGPHLFLDDALISETSDVTFTLHAPENYTGNPILLGENPYTDLDKAAAPFSVHHDETTKKWRMWYTPHSRSGLGYHIGVGTSTDGITWDYPDLGIVDFQGSTHNNLVLKDFIGGAVLDDPNAKNDSERYKGVFYRFKPSPQGFSVTFSPDGLHWSVPEWIATLVDRFQNNIAITLPVVVECIRTTTGGIRCLFRAKERNWC